MPAAVPPTDPIRHRWRLGASATCGGQVGRGGQAMELVDKLEIVEQAGMLVLFQAAAAAIDARPAILSPGAGRNLLDRQWPQSSRLKPACILAIQRRQMGINTDRQFALG